MKKTLLLIVILNLGFVSFGQEWTWPVVVSNNQEVNQYPDFVVDTNGIIHLVWMHKYNQYFSKIILRQSFNNGMSWSDTTDISKNDDFYMSNPKVACNDTGKILIAYDHNLYDSEVYISTYQNGLWSFPEQISTGSGNSHHNKCLVDKDGRFYVFWGHSSWKYYYKYMDGDEWSNHSSPYGDSTGIHSLVDFSVDKYNNLLWIGTHSSSSSPADFKLTYYFYEKQSNTWLSPELLTNHYVKMGEDIALDTLHNPHLDWRERDSALPYNDYTYYKYSDGENWTEQELVVEDPYDQQIAIDGQNNIHIVQREKIPNGGHQLVHYTKEDDEWVAGEIIDDAMSYLLHPKLLYHNNMLFLTYSKRDVSGEPILVYFTHYDIVTGNNNEKQRPLPICKLYPNPFSNLLNIEFETSQTGRVWVYITDMRGNLIKELNNSNLPQGKYLFKWDGTNTGNSKMPVGSYLIRMVSGKYQITKSIQLIY